MKKKTTWFAALLGFVALVLIASPGCEVLKDLIKELKGDTAPVSSSVAPISTG